jgi:ATP-dependent Clp protease ATP-binding subunit ClpC
MDIRIARLIQDLIGSDLDLAFLERTRPFRELAGLLSSEPGREADLSSCAAHPHPGVRAAAMEAALTAVFECSAPADGLKAALLRESALDVDWLVRRRLCARLEGVDHPLARDLLRGLLQDVEPGVRHAAVRACESQRALDDLLITLLRHDPAPLVRRTVAATLAGASIDTVWWSLLRELRRQNAPEVRLALLQALERLLARHPDWKEAVTGSDGEDLATLHSAMKDSALIQRLPRLAQWVGAGLEAISAQSLAAPQPARAPAPAAADEVEEHEVDEVEESAPPPDIGTDLAAELQAGRLLCAYESEALLATLEERLNAKGSRSALLVGEPGTGKTAIVHELARRLIAQGWVVLQVTPSDFVVNTKYLGEWQTRLKRLTEWAESHPKALIYIPEAHLLSDTGRATDSRESVAGSLAPLVGAGKIRVLAECSAEQLRNGARALDSLANVLLQVQVPAADRARTQAVLRQVAREHGQELSEEFLGRVVEAADLHLAQVQQPGRSVGLLKRILSQKSERYTPRDILGALSRTTGLPVDFLDDDVPLDLGSVKSFLEARVMGQSEAVHSVLDLVTMITGGLCDPLRPLGVLLFVGPTGVGKTELSRALAELIFGDPGRMIRLDMSEYSTPDALYRLAGSAARPGTLTSFVREQPFSVVLLDEFEKAHASVFDACLQIFDAGRLSDAQGHTTSLRGTILIMTSNLGSAISVESSLGFGRSAPLAPDATSVQRELRGFFRPELLNRIDRIIHFAPLSRETAERIARRELTQVLERGGIVRRGLSVDIDPEVLGLMLEEGYSPAFGARPLKRTIERMVLLPLARLLCQGTLPPGAHVSLRAVHGRCELELISDEAQPEVVVAQEERQALALRVRAGALVQALEALDPRIAQKQVRRSALMEAMGDPQFWTDRQRSVRVTDELERVDAILSHHQGLASAALAYAEWAARSTGRERSGSLERLSSLEFQARTLDFVLQCEERELGDAFVVVRLLRPHESALGIVEKLARMYSGWAERHRFQIEWLDDRCGQAQESAALRIGGPGAYGLLAAESGIHQFFLEQPDRRRDERELARVEVFPAAVDASIPGRADLRIESRVDRDARGRLIDRPHLQVLLQHKSEPLQVEARTHGTLEDALERLLPLLMARRARVRESSGNEIIRRYRFGASPGVRDRRSGRSTPRLARVLEGDLDAFLLGGE